MISIARVASVPSQTDSAEFQAAHDEVFGDACTLKSILRDPSDDNQIAVVLDVKDLEKVRSASRTPEGDAMMRKFGFLEQLSYFVEE